MKCDFDKAKLTDKTTLNTLLLCSPSSTNPYPLAPNLSGPKNNYKIYMYNAMFRMLSSNIFFFLFLTQEFLFLILHHEFRIL